LSASALVIDAQDLGAGAGTGLGVASSAMASFIDALGSPTMLLGDGLPAASPTGRATLVIEVPRPAPWRMREGERTRGALDGLAERVDSRATWADLVLPERQMTVLTDIARHMRHRQTVYETWGLAATSARGLGITALFSGESGTGKTLAAEVLAHDLDLDLYRIDLAAIVSKYIGETEKNLKRLFDAADAGGAVLLFDEADALFGRRSSVKDSHDRYANIEVAYLLQRMEAYRGVAILTTNMKSLLEPAFLRRIRFVVTFPFPDVASRARIWARMFPERLPQARIDSGKLARLAVTGGHIRNIAINAAFHAAEAQGPLEMRHLLQATRDEYAKLEKPLTDAEIGGWV
jgi:SpoVK/Ycf46/Vps4 family AAA+-type ATPase